jgi:hypothetical protein
VTPRRLSTAKRSSCAASAPATIAWTPSSATA